MSNKGRIARQNRRALKSYRQTVRERIARIARRDARREAWA
jgi:hypothetical protein